ncbi:hypothetical protein SK128_019238 [Halocaridina rubra]|uniref:C2H2-type domain-containing protein n=1 Tax=Halocaridina rubra TaxID=373956 RepID=A0AAN8WN56_HALRR
MDSCVGFQGASYQVVDKDTVMVHQCLPSEYSIPTSLPANTSCVQGMGSSSTLMALGTPGTPGMGSPEGLTPIMDSSPIPSQLGMSESLEVVSPEGHIVPVLDSSPLGLENNTLIDEILEYSVIQELLNLVDSCPSPTLEGVQALTDLKEDLSSTVVENASNDLSPALSSTAVENVFQDLSPTQSSTVAENVSHDLSPTLLSTVVENVPHDLSPTLSSTVAENVYYDLSPTLEQVHMLPTFEYHAQQLHPVQQNVQLQWQMQPFVVNFDVQQPMIFMNTPAVVHHTDADQANDHIGPQRRRKSKRKYGPMKTKLRVGCPTCGQILASKGHLSRHEMCHLERETKASYHRCHQCHCYTIFARKDFLIRHVENTPLHFPL